MQINVFFLFDIIVNEIKMYYFCNRILKRALSICRWNSSEMDKYIFLGL